MTPDEPYFPPPEEARRREPAEVHGARARDAAEAVEAVEAPYRAPEPPPAPAPVVVARAEPPPPSVDLAKKAAPRLTTEEMKALLAVDGSLRASPVKRAVKRGGAVLGGTTLASIPLHYVFGWYAELIIPVVVIAAIGWIGRPLFKKDDWS